MTPLHTEFVMLEAANRTLGASGELVVLERECARLSATGRVDLAERVEHVSATRGDGLGDDIASFDDDGRPRLIAVKTTRRGKARPMIVSRNEVAVSEKLAEVSGALHDWGCRCGGESAGLAESPDDVLSDLLKAEGGAAEALEAPVDRLGETVAGPGPIAN